MVLQLEQGQSLFEISAQQPALLQLVAYQDVVLKTLALDLNDVQLKLAFLQRHLQYELHRALVGADAIESKRTPRSATVRLNRNYLRLQLSLHADFFLVLDMLATDAKMRRLLLHPQLSPAVLQRLQELDSASQAHLAGRTWSGNRQSTKINAILLNQLDRLRSPPESDASADDVQDCRQFAQELFVLNENQRAQLSTLLSNHLRFMRVAVSEVVNGDNVGAHKATTRSTRTIDLYGFKIKATLGLNALFFPVLRVLSDRPQVRQFLLEGEPGKALSLQLQTLVNDINQVLEQRQEQHRRRRSTANALPASQAREND